MIAFRLVIGFALTAALSGCSLPAAPLSAGNGEKQPNPPSASAPWPPPVRSPAGCDLYLMGLVTERISGGTQAAAGATVNWRHFEGGPFETANEIRADANGKYHVCVPTPPSVCESGACTLKYEVRATKIGYAAGSTSVVVDYNYWWLNDFRVPDLSLTQP